MATVKIIILKHQRREDNTWNVKIRITHERQSSYIATTHYVGSELIMWRANLCATFLGNLVYPTPASKMLHFP